jgi:hypothetical protein
MSNYTKLSPYYITDSKKGYLDVMTWREIPKEYDDVSFTITSSYQHRPDLLAYDLYQDAGLWWVFASRNPSVIKDPVYDMEPGTKIYLPKLSSMKKTLGI